MNYKFFIDNINGFDEVWHVFTFPKQMIIISDLGLEVSENQKFKQWIPKKK